jgi:pyruvate,water dikinase
MRLRATPALLEANMSWTQRFRDVTAADVSTVGGKNASLGEMLREVSPLGVRVPDGFAVTAGGYRHFLREAVGADDP